MLTVVTALDPEPCHDLFVMAGGASAALAGLLFVAVSPNLEQVLKYDGLPALAAQSVALPVDVVVPVEGRWSPPDHADRLPAMLSVSARRRPPSRPTTRAPASR